MDEDAQGTGDRRRATGRRLPAGARRPGRRRSAAPGAPRAPSRRRPSIEVATSTRRPTASATSTRTRDLGLPGEYPFTRGVQPTMYRSRFWTMRQYAGFATAEETNQRFRYLLDAGPDRACRSPSTCRPRWATTRTPRRRRGRSGRVGVPISSLADMETLFDGHAARRGQHLDDDQLDGADPARAVRRRGREAGRRPRERIVRARPRTTSSRSTSPAGPGSTRRGPSMRLVTDVFEFCAPRAAAGGTRSRSPATTCARPGRPAAQELAFTLADAIAYVEAAVEPRASPSTTSRPACRSSSPPGRSCSRRSPSSGRPAGCGPGSCGSGSGPRNPKSMVCRFHVQTAGSQPHRPVDRQQRRPDHAPGARRGPRRAPRACTRTRATRPWPCRPRSRARLALRTQQIIAYEAGVTETPDPLAGSYFVGVADQRARGGRPGLPRRDRRHGRDARRDRGRLPAAPDPGVGVPGPARDRARATRSSSGVNRFRDDERRRHARRSRRSTRRGSGARSRASAGSGPSATRPPGRRPCAGSRTRPAGTGNLLPPIIEAVAAYATVGEIADRLRPSWGVHRELITV